MKRVLSVFLVLVLLLSATSCNKNIAKYSFRYQSGASDYDTEMYYDDSFFDKPSNTYNPSLATASMSLALASFASHDGEYINKSKNAFDLLSKMGFEDIEPNSYFKEKPNSDSLGCVFGHKSINGKQMIACGVRGGNYESEWASNFTIGNEDTFDKYHKGFYEGSCILIDSLKEYIKNKDINGNIMLWMVGYSRGGGICNISAGRIDESINEKDNILGQDVSLAKDDLYAYCFETPRGVYYDDEFYPKSELFDNIFCIVNNNDLVTKVAMKDLSFTRYGVDKILFDNTNDIDYEKDIRKVIDFFNSYSNSSILGEYSISNFEMKGLKDFKLTTSSEYCNWTQGIFLEDFVSHLTLYGVQTRENYTQKLEEGLREILTFVFSKNNVSGSLYDLLLSIARSMLLTDSTDLLLDDVLHNQSKLSIDLDIVLMNALEQLKVDISKESVLRAVKGLIVAIAAMVLHDLDFAILFPLMSQSNFGGLAQAHKPELTLAFLRAMDPLYSKNPVDYSMDGKYYYIEIGDTSADVSVTYKGKEVVKIENGKPVETGSTIAYGCHRIIRIYLPFNNISEYSITSSSNDVKVSVFDYRYDGCTPLDVDVSAKEDVYSIVLPMSK